jgi:hypothetical protein
MLVVIGDKVFDPEKEPILIVLDPETKRDVVYVHTATNPCYFQFGKGPFTKETEQSMTRLARDYDSKNCKGFHFRKMDAKKGVKR